MYVTSANPVSKPTDVVASADALGVTKRMSTHNANAVESDGPAHRDEELLRELYHEQELTGAEIGERLGVAQCTVSKWLLRHNIETRTAGGTQTDGDTDKLRDAEWLRTAYTDDGRSMDDIAAELGVSQRSVWRWFERHGIETRRPEETAFGGEFDRLRDAEWLRTQYVDERRSAAEIADETDVVETTVRKWLRRHDIDVRRPGVPGGERHPDWKGGVGSYYGKSWPKQRPKVIDRDGGECVICGDSDDVHVHHIIPFRKFGIENHEQANQLDNLVCLCQSHHRRWEGIPLRPVVE